MKKASETATRRTSIRKLLLGNMLFITAVSFVLLYLLWIRNEYVAFVREAESIREEFAAGEKKRLQREVIGVRDYIRYMQSRTEIRLRQSIRDRVNEACAIAGHIYEENRAVVSPGELRKMVKDALRPIRFNQGRGYYFAFGLDGIEELFADRPEMEGRDMREVRGARDERVVPDMIEILQSRGEGFYEYYWTKPGTAGGEFLKIAFVKRFDPFQWGIGTGEYLDDVAAEIQDEVLERIATLWFEEDGYFFGSTFDGMPLFTNGKITRGSGSIRDLTDPNGVKIIREQIRAAGQPEGGFVAYSWPKPDSDRLSPKLSYVVGIPEWRWVIGAGVYLDTIEADIAAREKTLYKGFIRQAILYFGVMAILGVLILLWTRRNALTIQSGIHTFSRFFEAASTGDATIDPDGLAFEEFKNIARFANQMTRRRIQADQALEQSEKKYEAITRSARDAIFCKNADRRYTFVNPSMADLFGLSEEDIVGKTPEELFSPAHAAIVTEIDNRTFAGENVSEMRSLEIEGKEYTFHTIQVPLEVVDGRVTAISGIVRDMTEQTKIEKQRIRTEHRAMEQEKHALVGRIAGKMSHDFNNILGVIMGNAELALLDCRDPDIRRVLELIQEQTLRGRNLTRNLIAFAKDQEPKQIFIDINEKMDLVINLMKKEMEGIALSRQYGENLPEVLADPGMMEHALVNLIQNAVHALSTREHPMIAIRTFCSGPQVCFEIRDNGCGIPREHLDVIFDPLFTMKGDRDATGSYGKHIKGTGYGLSNVKKYVDQHHGTIHVQSEFGSGTTFTVCLPVIEKDLTAQERAGFLKSGVVAGKRILLVEDEPAIFEVQQRILTSEPCLHQVDLAQNGQAALELLERNTYDLVSLDYLLPGNINGLDIYRQIRKTDSTLPVLFISGNMEFIESVKELKIKDPLLEHLSKPCQNRDYVQAVSRLLDKGASDEGRKHIGLKEEKEI